MASLKGSVRNIVLCLTPAVILLTGSLGLFARGGPAQVSGQGSPSAVYKGPDAAEAMGRRVFHLGHSLVGRDMPAMLAQLGGPAHDFSSQLGWGTTLKAHWESDLDIAGFEQENDHPHYRDARKALQSGEYDAFVMTEMVEIKAAIRYFDSEKYVRRWIEHARSGNPEIDIFLYETWHPLDDKEGWLNRLDRDLERYWKGALLGKALGAMAPDVRPNVYLIPGGQVLAAFARAIEGERPVEGMTHRSDLFARSPEGELDQIHLNDHGAYLIALTHYAVLYGRSPVGLPHGLLRADGTSMQPLSERAARLMQETVWTVVSGGYVAADP